MRAAVCTGYGGPEVVRIENRPDPAPRGNEVLIRTRATTVASGDARIRASRFPAGFWLPARLVLGLTRPRRPVLGTELAGVIEAVGGGVTRFRPGDEVIAFSGIGLGCHAELKAMPQDGAVVPKPAGIGFEEAAALSFGGTTALYFLRDVARLQPGERVLVNGASGAVGSAAVQLARHFGAHVTGVCSSANADLVRALGAHEVIDYRTADFADGSRAWDVIADTVGTAPFARSRRALAPRGRLLLVLAGLADLLKAPLQSRKDGQRVAGGTAPERAADVALLAELCAQGRFRPVIDSVIPFERIRDAHARVDSNRKRGSVVVTMDRA